MLGGARAPQARAPDAQRNHGVHVHLLSASPPRTPAVLYPPPSRWLSLPSPSTAPWIRSDLRCREKQKLEERRGSWSRKNSYGTTNLQRDTLSPPLPPPPPLLPPPSAPLRDHPFPLRAPLARLRGLPGSVSGEGVGEGIVCEYVYTKNRTINSPALPPCECVPLPPCIECVSLPPSVYPSLKLAPL